MEGLGDFYSAPRQVNRLFALDEHRKRTFMSAEIRNRAARRLLDKQFARTYRELVRPACPRRGDMFEGFVHYVVTGPDGQGASVTFKRRPANESRQVGARAPLRSPF